MCCFKKTWKIPFQQQTRSSRCWWLIFEYIYLELEWFALRQPHQKNHHERRKKNIWWGLVHVGCNLHFTKYEQLVSLLFLRHKDPQNTEEFMIRIERWGMFTKNHTKLQRTVRVNWMKLPIAALAYSWVIFASRAISHYACSVKGATDSTAK